MAKRPVFVPAQRAPFAEVYLTDLEWHGGFAVSQSQKNVASLHRHFNQRFPARKVLEISSASMQEEGKALSAFRLTKGGIPVECLYQGGKVFQAGGPFTDLYNAAPGDAKRDPRLRTHGPLTAFYFEGDRYPLQPKTAFYDWLYLSALAETPALSAPLLQYDAFTDIFFNPNKGVNCQARAAAIFVALTQTDRIDRCRSFQDYLSLLSA